MHKTRLTRVLLAAGLALAGLAEISAAQAANSYPVVFVHGFGGWGRDEMLGFKYWGGFAGDLQSQLMSQYSDGQQLMTVGVGPFSSNWERAVETFYQIKGGCVDYGAAHARTYGILQVPENYYHNGRTCFPGLYPQWDANHPIHLFGHSMGGPTSRMLVQLLAANGAPQNPGLFPYATSAAWVKSVTTLDSPNDGTTLPYQMGGTMDNAIKDMVLAAAALAGVSGNPLGNIYDFKLDQWMIAPQQPGEGFLDYVNRVFNSPLFNNPGEKNFSDYDNSPQGQMEANAWVQDQPGVYYFSIGSRSTFSVWGEDYADLSTDAYLSPIADVIGDFSPDSSHPFPAGAQASDWRANDGFVNSISHQAPRWARDANGNFYWRNTSFNDISNGGTPRPGAWNWLGSFTADHVEVIGWNPLWLVTDWYKSHIDRLRAL